MSSINTNLSAITALQSLKATQTAMNKNQDQISTGLRVSEASHNASYWSITTKMKSDNGALGAVKDSIKQSKAMIDTYSSALDKSLTYLNKMKTALVAGSNPGADKVAIQAELKASIEGLKSAASSATFNGENWLINDGTEEKELVTSYNGDLAGGGAGATVKKLTIDTSFIQMFDDVDSPATGKLKQVSEINIETAGTAATATFDIEDSDGNDLLAGETIIFNLGTYGDKTITVANGNESVAKIAQQINESELGSIVRASVKDGDLVLTSRVEGADFDAPTGGGGSTGTLDASPQYGIYAPGTGSIEDSIQLVEKAIADLTAGSAMLGANKALLETQEEFIGVLSDSLTAGVSAFIDADMNEVSTRNQALQTQQQLGVQALSMANQNSQMILKLFQ